MKGGFLGYAYQANLYRQAFTRANSGPTSFPASTKARRYFLLRKRATSVYFATE